MIVLDRCQISSLPDYCGFKEQEILYLYCRNGHLMKLKCKYSNILRYWIFDFHELQALITKIKTKQPLKYFTLHVMNLEYMNVSLFEISYKKLTFSRYSFIFLRCACIYKVHQPFSTQNFKENCICNDMIPLKY